MKKLFRSLFVTFFAFILVACGSTQKKLEVPFAVEMSATKDANPYNKRPSPIKITIFELKNADVFNKTDILALQGDDYKKVLGDQVISVKSEVLAPGHTKEFKFDGNPDSKVLGIVAFYRDYNNSSWRAVLDLPEGKVTNAYKFWQSAPNEYRVKVEAGAKEIKVLPVKQ